MPKGKPKLFSILSLTCPYCLETSLRKKSQWFEFEEGCKTCGYRFEREPGYFFAAPWVINYPLSAIVCFALSFCLFSYAPALSVLAKSALIALGGTATALFLFPYSRAIWMVADHIFNPLNEQDQTYS